MVGFIPLFGWAWKQPPQIRADARLVRARLNTKGKKLSCNDFRLLSPQGYFFPGFGAVRVVVKTMRLQPLP
jgi:hypothetical protein